MDGRKADLKQHPTVLLRKQDGKTFEMSNEVNDKALDVFDGSEGKVVYQRSACRRPSAIVSR
jgi:hypothetical protein